MTTQSAARETQCERAIQTEGGKFESYEIKRQDAEVQSQYSAENAAELSIVTYLMVIGNNSNENSFSSETINKDSNSFLSELIINENQVFVSDQLRKDNMVTADAKQTSEICTNDNESFISDHYKDPDLEAQTIQKKKKRKQEKKKKKSKMNISGNKSSDQRISNDELADAEIYSI